MQMKMKPELIKQQATVSEQLRAKQADYTSDVNYDKRMVLEVKISWTNTCTMYRENTDTKTKASSC